MSHHKKHKVVVHGWVNGKLGKFVYEFKTLKEAVHHAQASTGNSVKIYTDDELIEHYQYNSEIEELPPINNYA
jgi:hypothetical protein